MIPFESLKMRKVNAVHKRFISSSILWLQGYIRPAERDILNVILYPCGTLFFVTLFSCSTMLRYIYIIGS